VTVDRRGNTATSGYRNPPVTAKGGVQLDSSQVRTRLKEKLVPKMKTKRGAAKRFRRTANGFKAAQSHLNHILTKKSSKRKRQLGAMNQVAECDVPGVKKMLPYS
jgi:large subunit ribosomal protein L35